MSNPEIMKTPEVPIPNNLYEIFANSEYGKTLESNTRFSDFKPEWVTTELWCKLLGDDVNNLRHMSHTTKIAEMFCDVEGISGDTRDILLITATTHDWGEAIIGDISLVRKTEDDESREEVAYRTIANELLGDDVGQALADKVWPVLKKVDEVGDMFRAIEYVGYCTTGLRAGYAASTLVNRFTPVDIPRKQEIELVGGLMAMEKYLQVYSYRILQDYVQKYAGIQEIVLEGGRL